MPVCTGIPSLSARDDRRGDPVGQRPENAAQRSGLRRRAAVLQRRLERRLCVKVARAGCPDSSSVHAAFGAANRHAISPIGGLPRGPSRACLPRRVALVAKPEAASIPAIPYLKAPRPPRARTARHLRTHRKGARSVSCSSTRFSCRLARLPHSKRRLIALERLLVQVEHTG